MKKLKLLLIIPMIIACHSDLNQNYQQQDNPTSQSDTITNIEPFSNAEVDTDYRPPTPKNNSISKPLLEKLKQSEDKPLLINNRLTTSVSTTKIKEPESATKSPSNTSDDSSQNSRTDEDQPSSKTEEPQLDYANEEEQPPSITEESEHEPQLEIQPLCPNALYDEDKPCDYIHPNMLAKDELGRDVPSFNKPNKAWDWAENEMYDESSTWYMCGFTLMEGYSNDETIFFYAYMKAYP